MARDGAYSSARSTPNEFGVVGGEREIKTTLGEACRILESPMTAEVDFSV